MTKQTRNNLTQAQRERLDRFDAIHSVDVHCHCLPGLDDGPATLPEALELCRALIQDGFTRAIATPHQLGRYDGRCQASEVRSTVAKLNAALAQEGLPLEVVPGADVRVDERIPALLEKDLVLTLADRGRHLLLELPPEVFIDLKPLFVELAARGIEAVVCHPERNMLLSRTPQAVLPWLEQGAFLQVTAGSLLGEFGPAAARSAWYWLGRGAIALVATDAHNIAGRPPRMSAALALISERLGYLEAKRLCIDNPLRVFKGQEMLPRRDSVSLRAAI